MWRCARRKFNIIFPTVGDAAEIVFILKLPPVEVSIATQEERATINEMVMRNKVCDMSRREDTDYGNIDKSL